jgi:hypothetical protein
VTISGLLTGGSAGATVYLWQKLPGQASFQRVAQTTTNAAGDYTIVRSSGVMTTNASWYTTSSGATSATWGQRVSAQVKLLTWVIAGARVKLSGRVSPSHAGERITLQRRTGSGWRTIAGSVIGPSRFTVRHRFAHGGNVLLRAVFGGDARNARAVSAPLKIFVH